MLRRLSRCLRAVTSGLSGSAQSVATSGKVKLHDVCSMTADVLVAVTKLLEGKQSSQHLKQHDIRFCVNGDYERNAADGIHPNNTTLGSSKLVHWVCHNCPEGQLHLYQMMPNHCTQRQGSGCPYCAGKRVCKCNSLQTHYPMVSSEWDFARNDLMLAQVTSRSHQVVWWVNSVRGSWAQHKNGTHPHLNPK